MLNVQIQFNRRSIVSLLLALLITATMAIPALAYVDKQDGVFEPVKGQTVHNPQSDVGLGLPWSLIRAE